MTASATNLIGLGLLELLRHPERWRLLCADPAAAAPAAVEELMRYVSPVQTIQRVAVADVEIAGVRIPRDRAVIGLLGSGNRDTAVFDRPDELDIARGAGPGHLGFGLGPHFCLGASLARLEAEVALSTLARRFPGLQLATDPDDLRWQGNTMLRTIDRLPVRAA